MFSFIDFKNVVTELAVHAESEMINFTSGPLQGFTYQVHFAGLTSTKT